MLSEYGIYKLKPEYQDEIFTEESRFIGYPDTIRGVFILSETGIERPLHQFVKVHQSPVYRLQQVMKRFLYDILDGIVLLTRA